MERKYRVWILGDDTNPAGPGLISPLAEFTVNDRDAQLDDVEVFKWYVYPAALASWMAYRTKERMAEDVHGGP